MTFPGCGFYKKKAMTQVKVFSWPPNSWTLQDSLADLVLRLQLSRREKRGLELRESALRAQGPAHLLLLQQLRWERTHLAGDGSRGGSTEDPSSEEEDDEEDGQQHYQVLCPPSRRL